MLCPPSLGFLFLREEGGGRKKLKKRMKRGREEEREEEDGEDKKGEEEEEMEEASPEFPSTPGEEPADLWHGGEGHRMDSPHPPGAAGQMHRAL